eukprot:scaffold110756_cov16-Tisochrysis_lutea.AAC.1
MQHDLRRWTSIQPWQSALQNVKGGVTLGPECVEIKVVNVCFKGPPAGHNPPKDPYGMPPSVPPTAVPPPDIYSPPKDPNMPPPVSMYPHAPPVPPPYGVAPPSYPPAPPPYGAPSPYGAPPAYGHPPPPFCPPAPPGRPLPAQARSVNSLGASNNGMLRSIAFLVFLAFLSSWLPSFGVRVQRIVSDAGDCKFGGVASAIRALPRPSWTFIILHIEWLRQLHATKQRFIILGIPGLMPRLGETPWMCSTYVPNPLGAVEGGIHTQG